MYTLLEMKPARAKPWKWMVGSDEIPEIGVARPIFRGEVLVLGSVGDECSLVGRFETLLFFKWRKINSLWALWPYELGNDIGMTTYNPLVIAIQLVAIQLVGWPSRSFWQNQMHWESLESFTGWWF